jgi:hypothetical protein
VRTSIRIDVSTWRATQPIPWTFRDVPSRGELVVLSCRAHPRPCRIFACSLRIVFLSRNPMSSVSMAPRPVAAAEPEGVRGGRSG